MCGIFGAIVKKDSPFKEKLPEILDELFQLSLSRGKDASGIAVNNEQIKILKRSTSADKLIKLKEYKELIIKTFKNPSGPYAFIGHARMETNGAYTISYNNQPVVKDNIVSIHNGIIVNDKELWYKYPSLKRKYDIDTEAFNSLLRKYLNDKNSIIESVKKVYSEIEGAASIGAFLSDFNYLLLATNNGSLYISYNKENDLFIFASEEYFIKSLLNSDQFEDSESFSINQIQAQNGCLIDLDSLNKIDFSLNNRKKVDLKINKIKPKIINVYKEESYTKTETQNKGNSNNDKELKKIIDDEYQKNLNKINKLRRCSKCILPETMPFIVFDNDGVCNFCRNYEKMQIKGKTSLEETISKYRSKNGKPDCIVTFSGGRDSSYGLHYIKNELKMNPVAYTYDWGMITDLGRRNQSRVTAKLGIEHILISADIQRKRENIRKNVEAWLKKPDLGTVPLFMAGDKQYFYYANQLRQQMGIDLIFLCENPLERTDFKSGFCGIAPKKVKGKKFYALPLENKLKMAFYYANQYFSNPSYLNSTLFDTGWAFVSYYFIPHNYSSLYNYVRWDEKTVESALKLYNWEIAEDTPTTWRIGDGTASFYNYIYYTIAGFSENDTFRSNQIREGDLTRKEALKIANADNKPRINSLRWYFDTINSDLYKAVNIINRSPKHY